MSAPEAMNALVPRPSFRLSRFLERIALLFVWAALIAFFGFLKPELFLNRGNFSIMFASYAPAALLALAIIIPLTAGDDDLSVGATMTLCSGLIGVLNVWEGLPIPLVIVIALAVGVIVGIVNAVFIIYFRIPSLVVTLGTTSLMNGVVQWITNSSTIGGIDDRLVDMVVGERFLGVPFAFYYALTAAVALWYVFDFTPLGRRLLFVGRGREVARLNGIAVDRVRFGALIASAVLSAAAGVVDVGVLGSADPYSGLSFLLPPSRRPSRRHHHPARAVQSVGRDRCGLFPRHRDHRADHARHSARVTNVFNGGALILAVTISQLTRGREATDIG